MCEWTNYWDANPLEHGGAWIKAEDDGWNVVVAHPEPLPWNGDYPVFQRKVYCCDLFDEEGNYVDEFQSHVDSVHGDYHDFESHVAMFVVHQYTWDAHELVEDKKEAVESYGVVVE